MVFGWGKKKPQRHEDDNIPEIKQITLTKVSDAVKEIRLLRLKTVLAEVKIFRNKINSNRKIILNIATELERDNLKMDELDPHLMGMVKRGKNEVISVIKKETHGSYILTTGHSCSPTSLLYGLNLPQGTKVKQTNFE